jgi:hypothetical protein
MGNLRRGNNTNFIDNKGFMAANQVNDGNARETFIKNNTAAPRRDERGTAPPR